MEVYVDSFVRSQYELFSHQQLLVNNVKHVLALSEKIKENSSYESKLSDDEKAYYDDFHQSCHDFLNSLPIPPEENI